MSATRRGSSTFDRVRPRTPVAEPAATVAADVEGKRALFSSAEADRPPAAGIRVDCSRCGRSTALTPTAALRAVFPALHLAVGIARGTRETSVGLLPARRYGSWLRCPACGRAAWVRVTVQI